MDPAEASAAPAPPTVEDFPATGPDSLASVLERAVSTLLDGLLFLGPATVAVAVAIVVGEVEPDSAALRNWTGFGVVAAWTLYQVVLVTTWGRTLGSWAVGYRVARWSDGGKPDLGQASLRALLPAAFAALPIPILNAGWVLVFLAAAYNPLRRGFHDQAAGTVVVRTR